MAFSGQRRPDSLAAEQGAIMAGLRYSDEPGGATPAIEGAHAGTAPAPGHRP